MIDHIVSETRRVFKGTTHEDTCMFYHDALSQMTATSCREWMKKKGYDKMWITPELGLFEEDPSLNPYRGRPVGNCPELSCLDSSLNRDVKVAVHDNVRFTSDVPVDDPRKFSLATPEEGTRAYLRVLDPGPKGVAPTSKRIIEDTEKILESLKRICDAKGTVVADINNRTGRRREPGMNRKRGGKRERKQAVDDYSMVDHSNLHEDALMSVERKLNTSKRRHQS